MDYPEHFVSHPQQVIIQHEDRSSPRHSGCGIASFIMSVAVGVLIFITIIIAGVMELTTPGGMDEESPAAILVGLGICSLSVLSFVGLALGVIGLVQENRKHLFAILGLVFNSLIILGVFGLMILGAIAP